MITVKVAIHVALCAVLLVTVLARLVRTDDRTLERVTLAFWLLAVGAGAGLIAPWAYKLWPEFGRFRIHWATLLLEAGIVAVQLVTARPWQLAVPERFQKQDHFVDANKKVGRTPGRDWPPAPKGPAA